MAILMSALTAAPASASCEALRETTQVAEHYASAHFRGDITRDHYTGVMDLFIAVIPILERECSASKPEAKVAPAPQPVRTITSLCVEAYKGVVVCRGKAP
jgi:hypothetical protein